MNKIEKQKNGFNIHELLDFLLIANSKSSGSSLKLFAARGKMSKNSGEEENVDIVMDEEETTESGTRTKIELPFRTINTFTPTPKIELCKPDVQKHN